MSNANILVCIRATNSDMALTADQGANNGTKVTLQKYRGEAAQHWRVVAQTDGTSTVTCVCNGLRLDHACPEPSEGGLVHLWEPLGVKQQFWRIETIANRVHRLSSNNGSRNLCESRPSGGTFQSVAVNTPRGEWNQCWQLLPIDSIAFSVQVQKKNSSIVAHVIWQAMEPGIIFSTTCTPDVRQKLKRYLLLCSFTTPLSYQRTTESEKSILRAVPFAWSDAAHAQLSANRLTFEHRNHGNFIFSPVTIPLKEANQAVPVFAPWLQGSLFHQSQPPKCKPSIRCRCGASYAVESVKCPSCMGDDPLGVLSQNQLLQKRIESICADLIREPVKHPKTTELLTSLHRFSRSANNPHSAAAGASQKQIASILQRYFDSLFRVGITPQGLKCLTNDGTAAAKHLVAQSIVAAMTVRRGWWPATRGGWVPEPGDIDRITKLCMAKDGEIIQAAKATVSSLTLPVALYKPIRKVMEKQRTAGWAAELWSAIKAGLTISSAIASHGLSLLLKTGMVLFRDHREQQRWTRFVESIARANQSAVNLQGFVQRRTSAIAETHRDLIHGMTHHLVSVLHHDYAVLDADGQDALIGRLAQQWNLPLRPLRPRGKSMGKTFSLFRRKFMNRIPNWAWILIALGLAGIVAFVAARLTGWSW